jgi:hypothetical protein
MSRNCTSAGTPPAFGFKVIDEQEAALLQIRTQAGRLTIGHGPPADFDDVGDRILEEFRIVERDGVDLVLVGADEADLVHDLHQVALGERIAVDPRWTAAGPVAAGRRIVAHTDERKTAVVWNVGQRSVGTIEAAEAELRQGDAAHRADDCQRHRRPDPQPHT